MIFALMLGRGKSVGFPGKNTVVILGKPLMAYPLLAAKGSKYIDDIFVSTDSNDIKMIAEKYGAKHIKRPAELCTDKALGEDAFRHGYFWIKENVTAGIEFMVLLFANAVTISSKLIDDGIEILRKNPKYDSAVTVSKYNMWSPLRARKIDSDGLLNPFVPFDIFDNPKGLNCDRDSQGDAWFADMGASIVRPRCLDHLEDGILPQRWMGRKIYPLKQWGGCDVDYEWQIPIVEYWLKKNNIEKQEK